MTYENQTCHRVCCQSRRSDHQHSSELNNEIRCDTQRKDKERGIAHTHASQQQALEYCIRPSGGSPAARTPSCARCHAPAVHWRSNERNTAAPIAHSTSRDEVDALARLARTEATKPDVAENLRSRDGASSTLCERPSKHCSVPDASQQYASLSCRMQHAKHRLTYQGGAGDVAVHARANSSASCASEACP